MKNLFVFICLLSLAACATYDPYTGEKEASKATTGAAVGAITGAVVGAATSSDKDRDKGIITGAVAGAAVGGGIGYYMDRQEAKLRQKLRGSGVQVRREGNTIHLIMPGNITFATNQYNIRADFYPVLDSVVDVLKEFKKTAIVVSGHTDSTGSADYNQQLSEKRASAVGGYLLDSKISRGRVHSVGYGQRMPVASNATPEGRQQNRRVELKLEAVE